MYGVYIRNVNMAPKVGHKMIPVKCPLCNFSHRWHSKLELHIKEVHGRDPAEVWREWKGVDGLCKCGCGQLTNWGGWSLGHSEWVIGHNGNIYTLPEEEAKAISEKRSKALMGRPGWSKGLTKETSEIVRKRSETISEVLTEKYANGELTNWAKGLTKDTDERMQLRSEHLKEGYAEGKFIPWAKGLTKDTDDRVFRMSEKVKLSSMKYDLRKKLDSLKKLSVQEIQSRIESQNVLEVIGGLDQYKNDKHQVIKVRCKNCGAEFTESLRRLQYGRCFKCHPGGSMAQESVFKFIHDELNIQNIKSNDRKVLSGQELDMYIPDAKFAIEFNGLYWHNELNRSKQYHENKSLATKILGINLMHIFEDEWRTKQDIVKSMIRQKLGIQIVKIGARKCTIKSLASKEKHDFFTQNHIDGDTQTSYAFGLYHNEILVAAISLRTPLHKKWSSYNEIARYCTKIDHHIAGGLSKLIKHIQKTMNVSLMTYLDTRFGGTGAGYIAAGMKFYKNTSMRFWWTDCENRFNRFMYRADAKLGLTEAQVADAANVVKIWGCHSKIFTIELSDQRA